MNWKRIALCLAMAVAFAFTPAAQAAPVQTVDGVIGIFTLTSPGGGGNATLSFGPVNAATLIDGSPAPFNMVSFAGSMTISGTGVPVLGGTLFAITGATVQKEIGWFGAGSTAFDLTGNSLFVPSILANTALVSGTETLASDSNTLGLDFSQFAAAGGVFTMTLGVTPGTDLADLIANGGTILGTAQFNQTANSLPVVPEPTSFVVFGVASVAGIFFARRRWLKPAA